MPINTSANELVNAFISFDVENMAPDIRFEMQNFISGLIVAVYALALFLIAIKYIFHIIKFRKDRERRREAVRQLVSIENIVVVLPLVVVIFKVAAVSFYGKLEYTWYTRSLATVILLCLFLGVVIPIFFLVKFFIDIFRFRKDQEKKKKSIKKFIKVASVIIPLYLAYGIFWLLFFSSDIDTMVD